MDPVFREYLHRRNIDAGLRHALKNAVSGLARHARMFGRRMSADARVTAMALAKTAHRNRASMDLRLAAPPKDCPDGPWTQALMAARLREEAGFYAITVPVAGLSSSSVRVTLAPGKVKIVIQPDPAVPGFPWTWQLPADTDLTQARAVFAEGHLTIVMLRQDNPLLERELPLLTCDPPPVAEAAPVRSLADIRASIQQARVLNQAMVALNAPTSGPVSSPASAPALTAKASAAPRPASAPAAPAPAAEPAAHVATAKVVRDMRKRFANKGTGPIPEVQGEIDTPRSAPSQTPLPAANMNLPSTARDAANAAWARFVEARIVDNEQPSDRAAPGA